VNVIRCMRSSSEGGGATLAPSALPDFVATMSGSDSRAVMTSSSLVRLGLWLQPTVRALPVGAAAWVSLVPCSPDCHARNGLGPRGAAQRSP
jgi:hypothetical protein